MFEPTLLHDFVQALTDHRDAHDDRAILAVRTPR